MIVAVGNWLTVSVAALLVAVPKELVTTARYWPASAVAALDDRERGRGRSGDVRPGRADELLPLVGQAARCRSR